MILDANAITANNMVKSVEPDFSDLNFGVTPLLRNYTDDETPIIKNIWPSGIIFVFAVDNSF